MKQFILHLGQKRTETLGIVGNVFGKYEIDVITMAGTTAFGVCTAILIVDKEEEARKQLQRLNIAFSTQEIFVVTIRDEPGSLGELFEDCAKNEITILSFTVLRFQNKSTDVVISVPEEDFQSAIKVLKQKGYIRS